jgi:hypothetical protein
VNRVIHGVLHKTHCIEAERIRWRLI